MIVRLEIDGWDLQRVPGESADFTRDADERCEVGTVWGDFQIVNDIACGAAEMLRQRLADLSVGGQNEQTFCVFGKREFLGGTHHALRFNATEFADFDCKWRRPGR